MPTRPERQLLTRDISHRLTTDVTIRELARDFMEEMCHTGDPDSPLYSYIGSSPQMVQTHVRMLEDIERARVPRHSEEVILQAGRLAYAGRTGRLR